MNNTFKPAIALVMLTVILTGCASSQSGSVYERYEAGQIQYVDMGVIEHVRLVTIEGTESGVGTASGAVIGGIGGSTIGGGRGSAVAAVVGAVVGGIIGSAIEEDATETTGVEITVRLDSGQTVAIVQTIEDPVQEHYRAGDRVRVLTDHYNRARVVPLN
ncbi:MAG: glycine zipper domain-containing protein [Pseudomonadota bacterium]